MIVDVVVALLLLATCVLLSVGGEHVLRFTRAAADTVHAPERYIDAVLHKQPVPARTGSER